MYFSSVVAFLVLFGSIAQMPGIEVRPAAEKFNLLITERGTGFVEQIEIDEDKDIEYFKVPAHNGLQEAEYLYDFKNNQTVLRLRSHGVCYIDPLPARLPRPALLKTGLQTLVRTRQPSLKVAVVNQTLAEREQVDKETLRREVREFCDQYPVYRREKYVPDSVLEETDDTVLVRSGRVRRDLIPALNNRPLCRNNSLPATSEKCRPNDWLFRLKIRDSDCTYYVRCILDQDAKTLCEAFEHLFSSLICYTVSCP